MKTTIFMAAILLSQYAQAQEIQFETSKIEYGTIEKGADGLRRFVFKNVGTTPLVIENAVGSCGCTVPTWPKEPIMPGASGAIEVKYNTQLLGDFSKSVTVTSNDSKNSSVRLSIVGKVEEESSATPAKLSVFKD